MPYDKPTDRVAKRASDRERNVKIRERAAAQFQREKVGDDGGGCRPVSPFADADKESRNEQQYKSTGQARGGGGHAPKDHAGSDDNPARHPIRQPAKNWRGNHVANQKSWSQPARLLHSARIARGETRVPYFGLDGRQDLSIDVIQEFDDT